jgi:uncharacterized membrane protein
VAVQEIVEFMLRARHFIAGIQTVIFYITDKAWRNILTIAASETNKLQEYLF